MPKCIYRCASDNMCAASTSDHHCEIVNDEICKECQRHQDKVIVSKSTLLMTAIENAILALKDKDTEEAMTLLCNATKF